MPALSFQSATGERHGRFSAPVGSCVKETEGEEPSGSQQQALKTQISLVSGFLSRSPSKSGSVMAIGWGGSPRSPNEVSFRPEIIQVFYLLFFPSYTCDIH